MFQPQALPDTLLQDFDTSQGRVTAALGMASDPTGGGREPNPLDPDRADEWTNSRYDLTAQEAGAFDQQGRGDRAPLPPTRTAHRFLTSYYHDSGGGSVGGSELRMNLGGHVVIRRMPNAGQAQGGMLPVPATPNQRRVIPDHWDANLFIGGS
jgi:hypothetical protein